MRIRPCHTWSLFVLFLVAIAAGGPARGDVVIFDNGMPDGLGGVLSRAFSNTLAADSFVLDADASVVTDLHWWGAFVGGVPTADSVTFGMAIFDDSTFTADPIVSPTFTPLMALAGSTVEIGGADHDLYVFNYYFPGPLALVPGQTYYLVIAYLFGTPSDPSSTEPIDWYWATSNQSGTHLVLDIFRSPYVIEEGTGDLAFQLTGPVIPEPGTLALVGVGLAAFAARRLRRGARNAFTN